MSQDMAEAITEIDYKSAAADAVDEARSALLTLGTQLEEERLRNPNLPYAEQRPEYSEAQARLNRAVIGLRQIALESLN